MRLQTLLAISVTFEDQHSVLFLDVDRRRVGRGLRFAVACVARTFVPLSQPLFHGITLGPDLKLDDGRLRLIADVDFSSYSLIG